MVFYCANEAIYSDLIPAMLHAIGLDPGSDDLGVQLACGTFALAVNLVVCTCVAELVNRVFPSCWDVRGMPAKYGMHGSIAVAYSGRLMAVNNVDEEK